jgi:SAM-dependent MidA family methyltransferase
MTPVGEILAAEIRRGGPIPFRRFMEVALYHPEHGYYRRARDPFGKRRLLHGGAAPAGVRHPDGGSRAQLWTGIGKPAEFTVVELGAGRREMAEAFAEWRYCPIDVDSGEMPENFTGVVFSNEFFDALAVDVTVYDGAGFREQLVGFRDGRFVWTMGDRARGEVEEYLRRYFPPPEPGNWYEANVEALGLLERIARRIARGHVFTVDYGYTRAESIRFPAGTLMGYRRHAAREDVLEEPGERDITAHVNFTALEEHGARVGLAREKFETLAQTLLAAGEADQFAAAMAANPSQLKTLLFGMGETFRVLIQKKE